MQALKEFDASNVDCSKLDKVEDYIPLEKMVRDAGLLDWSKREDDCDPPCFTVNENQIKAMVNYTLQGTTSVHRPQNYELSEEKAKEIEEKYLKNLKEQ